VAWFASLFVLEGYPAVMVADTALNGYPHYHKTTDTPDKIEWRAWCQAYG
jgi:hypothetical protein